MSRVYFEQFKGPHLTKSDVIDALEWLEWGKWFPTDARVFIKPNLTWPDPIQGVTTTPEAIDSVVAAIRERTAAITIGEADGFYHSFRADEALKGHRVYEIAEEYGAQVTNLSGIPAEPVTEIVAGRSVTVELPKMLLHEIDVFITVPVPKLHSMTGVSLALKNQWGCLPSATRMRDHSQFDRRIIAINRRLNPRVAIFDGTFFLDRSGPITGEAIPLQQIIVSNDIGAGSLVCCEIMGINALSVSHLLMAHQEGMMPGSTAELELNTTKDIFSGHQFRLQRSVVDWLSLMAFRSRWVGWLFWNSFLSGALRWLLNTARRNGLVRRLLYGEVGMAPDIQSKSK